MNKIITIYCEGKKGSHDYDILSKIVEDIPVQISPIGSIRGASAIIQYKEKEIVKSDFKILFRDRDFDKAIPNEEKLEQDNEKPYIYYSYRNTIENYLFRDDILLDFLTSKKLDGKYGIKDLNATKTVMIEAANKIKAYQAARHTMGKLRTHLTNFGTKLTKKSGVLPTDLSEEFCKKEAFKRIETAKSYTENWTIQKFEEVFIEFSKKFDDDFINSFGFLIYFQGKDYAASLKSLLPDFPLKSYYKFAKEHFDFNKYKDLIDLKELIQNEL